MNPADDKRPIVVIGTSGSTDFLKDTGDRRFWPVQVQSTDPAPPLSAEDRAIVDRLVALNPEACDGIHDEGAPAMYLCTRCFPDSGADLVRIDDEDDCQDESEQME